jgi:ATP-binding cassette subfamily C protein CydD
MLDRRLLREAAGNRYRLALIIGLGLAGGVLSVLQADLLARTINGVFLEGLDAAGAGGWLAALAAVMVLRSAGSWAASAAANSLAAEIKQAMRTRLVRHLFRVGPVGAVGMQAGDLITTLSQGVENLEPWFARFLPQLAAAVLIPVLILVPVFPLDVISALIMLVTAPLIPVFMVLIGQAAGRLNDRQWEKLSRLQAQFLDVLQGLVTLKLFGRSKEQIAIIERMSNELRDTTLSVLRVAFLSSLALELLTTISIAVVAVTVGLRLLYGDMDFYQAFFLLLIAPEFYLPLRLLGGHYHAGMAGTAAANSIFALLDKPVSAAGGGKSMPRQDKIGVSFCNICCSYGAERPAALNGVSFDVPAGTRAAFVGPSGAGKTTVLHLLLGMMAPQEGRILVNGLELADVKREERLRHVGFVPQFGCRE